MAIKMDDMSRKPGDEAFRRDSIKGTQWEATYAGALSFMRRKYTRDLKGVDIAVTGIPFDQAVSHRSGTRMGPEGIRRASAENAWGPFWPWNFDPFDTLGVIDYGDCFFDWGRKENFPETLEQHATEIISSGAEMISLGGDHYVSYPLLKAHHKKHGPLALVHFDAHRDVEVDDGGRIDHGTMFGYAVREGLIDPHKSTPTKFTKHLPPTWQRSSPKKSARPRPISLSTLIASIRQSPPAPELPSPEA
jgi:agmatinase